MQPFLGPLLHFEIVVADDGGRRVDQPVVDEGALEQHVGRIDQAEGVGVRFLGWSCLLRRPDADRPQKP